MYELIGISTENKLDAKRIYSIIHLYKSEDGKIKIRLGSKNTAYEDIPYFLASAHTLSPEVILFVGKGIALTDIKNVYLQIAIAQHRKVTLVVNNSRVNEYEIFIDNISIWSNEIEEYSKVMNMPSPPPLVNELRKDYWEKHAVKIEIGSSNNLEKLSNLVNNKKYLIYINHDMSIEDYLKIKKEAFALQRTKGIELQTIIK